MDKQDKYFLRIDRSKIAPFFLEKCEELIYNCRLQGKSYYAISGFRSPEEQAKLYAQGRTTPGNIVTNSQPFKSFHNFGLAMDFCWDMSQERDGLQPGWEDKDYKVLADEAQKLGLTAGYYFYKFPDSPHIQTPPLALSLANMEEIYKKEGLQAVWDKVHNNLKTLGAFKKNWK